MTRLIALEVNWIQSPLHTPRDFYLNAACIWNIPLRLKRNQIGRILDRWPHKKAHAKKYQIFLHMAKTAKEVYLVTRPVASPKTTTRRFNTFMYTSLYMSISLLAYTVCSTELIFSVVRNVIFRGWNNKISDEVQNLLPTLSSDQHCWLIIWRQRHPNDGFLFKNVHYSSCVQLWNVVERCFFFGKR